MQFPASGDLSYFFEVHSLMNLVRAAPVIFCSLACLVQSAFFCRAASFITGGRCRGSRRRRGLGEGDTKAEQCPPVQP